MVPLKSHPPSTGLNCPQTLCAPQFLQWGSNQPSDKELDATHWSWLNLRISGAETGLHISAPRAGSTTYTISLPCDSLNTTNLSPPRTYSVIEPPQCSWVDHSKVHSLWVKSLLISGLNGEPLILRQWLLLKIGTKYSGKTLEKQIWGVQGNHVSTKQKRKTFKSKATWMAWSIEDKKRHNSEV